MILRDAVRRSLSILSTLVAVSAVALWAIATFVARTPAVPKGPFAALPMFFNPEPESVRELSLSAMQRVARGGPDADVGRALLTKLGGAALPFVLPSLDTLVPEERARVALALVPVAERMNVVDPGELETADQAVVFWTRFWQDRAIDFRTTTVHRLVARLAERSLELRREDVIHVDTFALPSLIEALGPVSNAEDIARLRRLAPVLSHVSGQPWQLAAHADLAAARAFCERWLDFWDREGEHYVALDGPRRLTAVVAQTQYGKWLRAVLRGGLGRTGAGHPALDVVGDGLFVTVFLLGMGLAGGFGLGAFWAGRESRARSSDLRRASAAFGLAIAALPSASLILLFSRRGAGLAAATIIIAVSAAAWVSRYLARAALERAGESPVRRALSLASPLGVALPPLVVTSVVVAEVGFRLPGIGRLAVIALRSGDVNAWMAACLALSLATLLFKQAADLTLTRREALRAW